MPKKSQQLILEQQIEKKVTRTPKETIEYDSDEQMSTIDDYEKLCSCI